jgi:hypothetical protein
MPNRRQKLRADNLAKPPSVFAYRARRSESERTTGRQVSNTPIGQPPPATRRRLGHFWLQRFGLVILLLAVLASAVNVLSLSSDAKIVPLTTTANQTLLRDEAVYQTAADRQLSSSIWNRNKITINTSSLSRQLLNQFPELSNVSVTIPLLAHRPLVYVEAAQPALILVTGNGSFIIDTTGKALISSANPAGLDQPNLPLLTDQSGLHIQINRQALPSNDVSFIQVVIAELAAKQFTVSGMTLPAAASELDVHLTGQPYFVKFNLQNNDPRGQAGTFLATITQLRRQNITPGQYVDVRVDGRAYYK